MTLKSATLAALALFGAAPLLAQEHDLPAGPPMSIEEVEAFVTGKTMTYTEAGITYGVEQYLPDRRVAWRFGNDTCQYGEYFVQDAHICFLYEDEGVLHCWDFWPNDDESLIAAVVGETVTSEVRTTSDGLNCPAPYVGVKY